MTPTLPNTLALLSNFMGSSIVYEYSSDQIEQYLSVLRVYLQHMDMKGQESRLWGPGMAFHLHPQGNPSLSLRWHVLAPPGGT